MKPSICCNCLILIIQGLKKFCDDHPQLEYLYIDTEIFDGQLNNRSISVEPRNGLDHKIGNADWKLLKLKILGYKSASVDKGIKARKAV